jgi:hypothetical protein
VTINHAKPPVHTDPRAPQLAVVLALVLALAGCGIMNPYSARVVHNTTTSRSATSTSTSEAGDPVPERGGTIPPGKRAAQQQLAAGAGARTPQAALSRYAQLEINWTAGDVGRIQRELAAISLGPARAEALQAAASDGGDSVLQHSRVANSGTVVGVAQGQGTAAGRWVIVTSESTTGAGAYAGLPAALHVTYATVTHTRSGWVLETWQPQN